MKMIERDEGAILRGALMWLRERYEKDRRGYRARTMHMTDAVLRRAHAREDDREAFLAFLRSHYGLPRTEQHANQG